MKRTQLAFSFLLAGILYANPLYSAEQKSNQPTAQNPPSQLASSVRPSLPIQEEKMAKKDEVTFNTIIDWILKLTNLGLILYIFRIGRDDRKNDQIRAVNAFWFQEIAIKGGKPSLDEFFEKIDTLCESHIQSVLQCKTSNGTVKAYDDIVSDTHRQFNQLKTSVRRKFVNMLDSFGADFSEKLTERLNDFQDSFGALIRVKTEELDPDKLRAHASTFRSEFLNALYCYHATLLQKAK
jgi:hypothetical protein